MAEPVLMPQVGQDIKTARIIDWLKKENDEVKQGEVIAVVESDKAAFDVEAYTSGVLVKILHPEGEEVEVLTPIAYIGQAGEKMEDGGRKTEDGRTSVPARQPQKSCRDARPTEDGRIAASPSARRVAKEKEVSLDAVVGTGPGGRIVKPDVLAAARRVPVRASEACRGRPARDSKAGRLRHGAARMAATPTPHGVATNGGATPADTIVAFSPMRARIAERLTRSKQTIPHFYLSVEVDMSEAVHWRRRFNETKGAKVTVTDMIVKAAATALLEYPKMNSHVEADRMILKAAINIGVAVSVEDGLIVPVIADADKKTILQVSAAARENAEAARSGRLKPQAIGGFTVTNLGTHGVDTFVPVINPPEAAILAVGAVAKRPAVAEGQIVARDRMIMTLACDHRAIDGTYAAQFLARVKQQLEDTGPFEPR